MSNTKKLISFFLAMLMLFSVVSVGAQAYHSPYKGDVLSSSSKDALDKPILTTEQYASAALDEVDRMLFKEQIKENIIIGELDVTSVDAALNSIYNLIGDSGTNNNAWKILKSTNGIGNLKDLTVEALKTPRRASSTTSDLDVLNALVKFISDNASLIGEFVGGTLDMGALSSLVSGLDINVPEMVKELLYDMAIPNGTGYTNETVDDMVQEIVDNLILGEKNTVTGEREGGFLPEMAGYTNFSQGNTYDFIENIFQIAYNEVVVPLLNDNFKSYMLELVEKNGFSGLLASDFEFETYTFTTGKYFFDEFNNMVGSLVNEMLSAQAKAKFTWVLGDMSKLKDNIVNLCKFLLKETDGAFFSSNTPTLTDAQIDAMSANQLASYAARAIVNASIDGVYVKDDKDTLRKVASDALKQYMALKVPKLDYSDETKYPLDSTQTILDIACDLAAYNLNYSTNMNAPLQQGADAFVNHAMTWAVDNYGKLLNIDFASATTGWGKLDKLLFGIINSNWLPAEVNGSSKSLIVDFILNNLLDLNFEDLFSLFERRTSSDFNSQSLKKVLIGLVTRVVNLVFKDALSTSANNFEDLITKTALQNTIINIFKALENRKSDVLAVGLPIVCDMLHLTDEQDFEFPEIALKRFVYTSTGNFNELNTSFQIRNGSTGINSGYYKDEARTDYYTDSLYTYANITYASTVESGSASSLTVTGPTSLAAGAEGYVVLEGSTTATALLAVTISYDVMTENGTVMGSRIVDTTYVYISRTNTDDLGATTTATSGGVTIKDIQSYYYLTKPSDLVNITVTLENTDTTAKTITGGIFTVANTGNKLPPYIEANVIDDPADYITIPAASGSEPGRQIFRPFRYTSDYTGSEEQIAEMLAATPVAPTSNYSGYNMTLGVTVSGVNITKTGLRLFLYNDYGIDKLIDREINMHRQPSDYDPQNDEWNSYRSALKACIQQAWKPKANNTFARVVSNVVQMNGYQAPVEALETAIKNLEACAVSQGVTSTENMLNTYTPSNPKDMEYDDPAYNYMGMSDYVPYTFERFRPERNAAQRLVNSQNVEEPGPDATPEEIEAYNEAVANIPVVNALTVSYTNHRFSLYYNRLIRVVANKAHLSAAITAFTNTYSEADYSAESWANAQRALKFANGVMAEELTVNGTPALRQTKVNSALTELIEAEKALVPGPDDPVLEPYLEPVDGASIYSNADYPDMNRFLFGIEELCYEDEFENYFLVVNGYVEFSSDSLGTGTTVKLYNNNGELHEVFEICILGDINGDAFIDENDYEVMLKVLRFKYLPEDGSSEYVAADLTGDDFIDEDDYEIMLKVIRMKGYLDQSTRKYVKY